MYRIEPSDLGDIVQAACLAHDIGNPPFGHSGEEAIRDWFRKNADKDFLKDLNRAELNDFQNFEGNAQGLRIITQLEYYLFEGGMGSIPLFKIPRDKIVSIAAAPHV